MKKPIAIFLWFVATIVIIDIGFEMVSMKSTFFNIVGLGILFVFALLSFKTKCFTSIKSKKNEKN